MNDTLEHHGILGMKWGVRRYQNKDGSWTQLGKDHRQSDSSIEANNERYKKYSVHSNDQQYRDKADPVLYKNVTTKHPAEVEEYAEINKAYYDYIKEKTPEIIVDYVNNIYGGKATAENFDDELQNDWDHSDVEAYLGSNANDSHYKELKEKWLSSSRQMYKLISDETDKYLSDNSDVKEYDMSSKIEDQILKDRNGKTQREMVVEINDLMNEAMYKEYKRLSGEDNGVKHSDDSTEDSLMHYGILGMKWGIRRYQRKDGSLTPAGRKRYGDDASDSNKSSDNSFDATARTPAKSASEMTDQELNQALNRLRMEQQYNELTGAKSSNQYQNQQNFSTPPSNTGNLSNAELQAYINRLDMEKRYKQLTTPPPKELNMGQKFVKEILPAVALEVGREVVKSTMRKALGLEKSNDGSDNDGSGKKNKNNNNNDGGKQKNYDKQFSETNSRIDKLANAINNLANNKQNSKSETKSSDSSGDEEKSSTSIVPYSEHRKSIIGGAKAAANAARENKKNRDALQDRLKGYRDRREAARNEEEERRKTAANNSSDYYRSMWTYGM